MGIKRTYNGVAMSRITNKDIVCAECGNNWDMGGQGHIYKQWIREGHPVYCSTLCRYKNKQLED